ALCPQKVIKISLLEINIYLIVSTEEFVILKSGELRLYVDYEFLVHLIDELEKHIRFFDLYIDKSRVNNKKFLDKINLELFQEFCDIYDEFDVAITQSSFYPRTFSSLVFETDIDLDNTSVEYSVKIPHPEWKEIPYSTDHLFDINKLGSYKEF
ncbi:hypothetical protein KKD49_12950, partial [Myxococcota bacterium]|nr:hypothetical protein [Myxococcota bacterium]